MIQTNSLRNGETFRRVSAWATALLVAVAGFAPLALYGTASAASLDERELQSSTAQPSVNTQLTWVFDTTADVANIDHIEIEFCDTPLDTCTTVNTPSIDATINATLGNFTTNTVTATTRQNGLTGGANNEILIDKTTVDAGASLNEASIQLDLTDITNNATANRSYYTRMRVYSDAGTTLVWDGVFAQSTSQTLTVTARVQERLDFCVGDTDVDDATTTTGANCAAINGSDVSLGVVDPSNTNVSPVDSVDATGADNENGVVMVRTNASDGVVVDYKALQNVTSGKLKVVGATCTGTLLTDQCFNSVGTTGDEIDSGVEEFGMAVAGTNCGSVTAYTCTFASSTYNLIRDTQYDGDSAGANTNTYMADNGLVAGTTVNAYAWDDTGTADRIAASTTAVDEEALILKFAATASATTPTGSYQVQADFIATATF